LSKRLSKRPAGQTVIKLCKVYYGKLRLTDHPLNHQTVILPARHIYIENGCLGQKLTDHMNWL